MTLVAFVGMSSAVLRRSSFCVSLIACSACSTAGPSRDVGIGAETSAAETTCTSPDAAGDWSWQKLGPVQGLPEAAQSGDGLLSPALVDRDGVLHLWYTQKTGSRYVLMHSVSTDGGASFASPTQVTGLGDDQLSAYPSVWWDSENQRFYLLFGSGAFKLATSDDGVAFTLAGAPSPVLSASFDSTRFDALSVLYPDRVANTAGDGSDGSGATLFFSGFDGQHVRIGRAVAQPDGTFSVAPPRPVLDLGAAADFDNSAVAQPHVQRAFGRWWMWYGGYDTSHTNPGPYRVGSASSADGVSWEKHGVAVGLSDSGTDAWSTRDPALLPAGGAGGESRWVMFYVGMGDDGRYRIHRAASDVCSSR